MASTPNKRLPESVKEWRSAVSFVAAELSVPPKWVTGSILPEWWDEELTQTRGGYLDSIQLLANSLAVSPNKIEARETLKPETEKAKCKGSREPYRTVSARSVASVLAHQITQVLAPRPSIPELSAAELRRTLLADGRTITLDTILGWCWENGIAVAHAANLPSPKPHAMVSNIENRCGVVLMRDRRHSGWHLFDLAHELGHVFSGHLSDCDAITDGSDSEFDSVWETEANRFACELLTGAPEIFKVVGKTDAPGLLTYAKQKSATFRVDPQWVTVATGHTWKGFAGINVYAIIGAALNEGWPDDDAPARINRVMMERVREAELSRSTISVIANLTRRSKA